MYTDLDLSEKDNLTLKEEQTENKDVQLVCFLGLEWEKTLYIKNTTARICGEITLESIWSLVRERTTVNAEMDTATLMQGNIPGY